MAHLFLVEDEDNIALALRVLLEGAGHKLTRVATGSQAVAAIAEAQPDVVILDVMLPGMSGYDICQELRATPAYDATPILMMTARGAEVERRKGLALGADAFITKPFSMVDLKDTIARLLANGRAAS